MHEIIEKGESEMVYPFLLKRMDLKRDIDGERIWVVSLLSYWPLGKALG